MQLPSNYDSTGAAFAWDATSLEAYCKCPRYYLYSIIESWQDSLKSIHLVFGGHYAKALETYHKLTIKEGLSHDDATVAVVKQTMIQTWVHSTDKEGNRLPGTGHVQPEFSYTNTKTRENLIRSIVWYLEEFKDSAYRTYVTKEGEPAVEHSFKLDIGKDIVWCGHIDRLVEEEGTGRIFVQDQKSTGSQVGANFFRQFDLSNQMSGYSLAGKIIYSIPIKGVMIDAAQVAVNFTRFMRGFTPRSDAQLEEWLGETHAIIREARERTQRYRETGEAAAFPRNLASCGNYGGCQFASVCSVAASLRSRMLEGNFSKREPWNPLIER